MSPPKTQSKPIVPTQSSCVLNLDSPAKHIVPHVKEQSNKPMSPPNTQSKAIVPTQSSCVLNLDSPAKNTRRASKLLNDSPAKNTRSASKLTPKNLYHAEIRAKSKKLTPKRTQVHKEIETDYVVDLSDFVGFNETVNVVQQEDVTGQEDVKEQATNKKRPPVQLDEIEAEDEYFSEHSSEEESEFEGNHIEEDSDSDGKESSQQPEQPEHEHIEQLKGEEHEHTEQLQNEHEHTELPDQFEFQHIIDQSYDCTEEQPESSVRLNWMSDCILSVGQEWATVYDCRNFIRLYGIKYKFQIWFQKNCNNKIIARCKDKSCPWRCYVARLNDGHTMVCNNLKPQHSCVSDGMNVNCLANARWIACMIQGEMRMHHRSFTARDIMTMVWHKYIVSIKYWKTWHARAIALEKVCGDYELSYKLVPQLCKQIELTNPGSLVAWQACPETNKFNYICVSFKASLEGWRKACRPIIGLDGCFLKGKYGGVCLCAIGMDANNGMFPLAIFVCRKEDGDNWEDFLSLIAPALRKHSEPLTVISDRQKGLINAIDKYFGTAYTPAYNQRFCFRHMFKNLNTYWKGAHIKNLCWAASSCYRVQDFNRAMDELELAAPGAKAYLLRENPSLWARSHFNKVSKCDHLTNNFTENFNSFILSTRDKSVCSMVTGVSCFLVKIMHDRKITSRGWTDGGLVPRVEKVINNYKKKVNDYLIEPSGNGTYCVRHYTSEHWIVDLNTHTCTCGEWQVTGIPCVHAVHLIIQHRTPFVQYCSPYFTVEAYRAAYNVNLKPIPRENEWEESNSNVLPPVMTRAPGRPRTKRRKGDDETVSKDPKRNHKKCKKCGGFGHNLRGCHGGPTAAKGATQERGKGGESVEGSIGGGRGGRGRHSEAIEESSGRGRGGRGKGGATGEGGSERGRGGRGRGGRCGRGGEGVEGSNGRGGRGRGANPPPPPPPQRTHLTIPPPPPPPPPPPLPLQRQPKKRIFFPSNMQNFP